MTRSTSSRNTPFRYQPYILGKAEYAKIISEINTNYGLYANESFCIHASVGNDGRYYLYYFENHGYNNYNVYARIQF